MEVAIQDPEGSAYGGGSGYIGGLAEGERVVSNIMTVNGDKMPAGLKDAAAQDLMLDAAGVALTGAGAAGSAVRVGRVSNRFDISGLRSQGHGPQRHSGLSEQQLADRVFDGIDPATGTRVDLIKDPNLHKKPSEATSFINDEAFVRADAAVRNSPEFQAAAQLNPERPVVKISLENALGTNYQNQVLGIKKIGPRADRQYEQLDFSNGSVQGFYNYNPSTKSYDLETLFPTQYPAN